jgi:hypothetical protein
MLCVCRGILKIEEHESALEAAQQGAQRTHIKGKTSKQ